jgi:hypothetical protein
MPGLINDMLTNGYYLSLIAKKVNLMSLTRFVHMNLKNNNYEGSFFLFEYVHGLDLEESCSFHKEEQHLGSSVNTIVRNPEFLKTLIGDGVKDYRVYLTSSLCPNTNVRRLYLNFKFIENEEFSKQD